MDLKEHFAAYLQALSSEALDGCEDYSKSVITQNPEKFPTIYNYISWIKYVARNAVRANCFDTYSTYIKRHQFAMIALFERMVSDLMWDYAGSTPKDILDLAHERGWNWFKFSKRPLKIPLVVDGMGVVITLIPRYSEALAERWQEPGRVMFDANEWSYILRRKDPSYSLAVIHAKIKQHSSKLDLTQQNPGLYPLGDLNRGRVVDWTLPLTLSS